MMVKPILPTGEPVQDGLLAYYLSCAAASDVNVERRIESEPFAIADHLKSTRAKAKLRVSLNK